MAIPIENRYIPDVVASDREPLQDECGIFAVYAPDNVAALRSAVDGLFVEQTRGYQGAGFAALHQNGTLSHYKNEGRIREVFNDEVLATYENTEARLWMLQTRYGTKGKASYDNVQPLIGTHQETGTQFIIVHNGEFDNPHLNGNGNHKDVSDTVEFRDDLELSNGESFEHTLLSRLGHQKGAFSLAIGTEQGLYLCRDKKGTRPLVYGKDDKGKWIAASETHALEAMGIHKWLEVMPGAIIRINHQGVIEIAPPGNETPEVCIFENVYLQDGNTRVHKPRKTPEEINFSEITDEARYRCGELLARDNPMTIEEADIVIGIPGTGIPGGKGYAEATGIPYAQLILDKDPQNARTFMHENIDEILQKVFEHFDFVGLIDGKRVVLVDDSIVRGNISEGLTRILKETYGATEVHWRVLCPPIIDKCVKGISTRSQSELIAVEHEGNIDQIRKHIKADSLEYLDIASLKEAITGNPHAEGFCIDCMDNTRTHEKLASNTELFSRKYQIVK